MMRSRGIIIILFFLLINSCKSKTDTVDKQTKDAKTGNPKTGGGKPGGGPGGPIRVDGYIVKASTLNESIDISGTLVAFDETDIHPEVSGKVTMLNIKEGAYITKGTLIARLFDGDLQAQLHKLQVQLQLAQKTEERQGQLLKIGGISQADYDLSILNTSSIRADIQVMQANISKTIILAPFNGKISFKNISIGAFITPTTVITTIRAVNQLKLEFSVPEKYGSKVGLGQFISFSTEGVPNKYSAKVIATESTISLDNRSLKVRALVDHVDKFLTAGSFAKVTFDMGNNNQAIMIPSQAIIPGVRDKKVVVDRGGTAQFQTVKTGTRDSANVQITDGLAVGDTLITSGLLSLKPGAKVQLSPIKK